MSGSLIFLRISRMAEGRSPLIFLEMSYITFFSSLCQISGCRQTGSQTLVFLLSRGAGFGA